MQKIPIMELREPLVRWQFAKLNITSDNLDPNPWLLNVKNGTIDVTTGEFREHRREDMITKTDNVNYDSQADCPLWKQFIREIMDYKADIIGLSRLRWDGRASAYNWGIPHAGT